MNGSCQQGCSITIEPAARRKISPNVIKKFAKQLKKRYLNHKKNYNVQNYKITLNFHVIGSP